MNTTESRHSFQGKPVGAGRSHAATDIGVVVVTYQSARTIRRCLDLLLASTPVARIVVIDNASDDGTLDLLRDFAERHEEVTVVRNSDNRGFAAACNQGASALATPWVAFVNPDCYVPAGAIERLVQSERDHYRSSPDDAKKLLATGMSKAGAELDPVELAAWTSAARAVLNLNETITRN